MFTPIFHGQNRAALNVYFNPPIDSISRYWSDIFISEDGKYITATTMSPSIPNNQIYTSNDYGSTFVETKRMNSHQTGGVDGLGFSCVNGSNNGKFQMVSGNHTMVLKSNDYGNTWIQDTVLGIQNWNDFYISDDGLLRYALEPGGFWKSVNGGLSWIKSMDDITDLDIKFSSSSNGQYITIVGKSYYNSSKYLPAIYISDDYGESFTLIGVNYTDTLQTQHIAISSSGQFQVWSRSDVPDIGTATNQLFVSNDYGKNWINRISESGGNYIGGLQISHNGDYILATIPNLNKNISSTDFGLTFSLTTSITGSENSDWKIASKIPKMQVFHMGSNAENWIYVSTNYGVSVNATGPTS